MGKYNPVITPEITLVYDYQPVEPQSYYDPGCDENVEISEILIHGQEISGDLEEDLLGLYGDDWEMEILNEIKKRDLEDIGEFRFDNMEGKK